MIETISPQKVIVSLTLDIEPVSKARPRFNGRGRPYTPKRTRDYEATLAVAMRKAMGPRAAIGDGRTMGMACVFRRKTKQRVDCDNMLKAVSDAANGIIWADDVQCIEVYGRLHRDCESPSVQIVFYSVDAETGKERPCVFCGKVFRRPPSQMSDYCSRMCADKSKRVTKSCKQCGKTYELPQSVADKSVGYCSRNCAGIGNGANRRAAHSDKWTCEDCGSHVTRREYKVCRSCSMKRRSDPSSNYWKLRHKKKPVQTSML